MNYFPKQEWVTYAEGLASEAAERWSGVSVSASGPRIQASIRGVMAGTFQLEMAEGDADHMVPKVVIGSATSYPSSLVSAQSHHHDVARVLEVLFFLARRGDGVRVYPNGKCPCSHCSGRGTVAPGSGTPCTNCDGKGTR